MADAPLLSIVTPCLNPGPRLDRALRSIATAPHGLVEYIIMDGGSVDGSVERIARFARAHPSRVTHWFSAPDAGQSDAINRGFARARGVFGAWLNADDWYVPGALARVVERLRAADTDVLVARTKFIDERGRSIWEPTPPAPITLASLMRLRAGWFAGRSIAQPEAFFRLELFRRVGGLRVENHYSMDHELWMELAAAGARFEDWPEHVANLGVHARQKTANRLESARCITASTRAACARHRGALAGDAHDLERELDAMDQRIALVDRVESWWQRSETARSDSRRAPDWDAVAEFDRLAMPTPSRNARRHAISAAREPVLDWLLTQTRRRRPNRVLVLARDGWSLLSRLGRAWTECWGSRTPTTLVVVPRPWVTRVPKRMLVEVVPLDAELPAGLGRFDLIISENILACGPEAIAARVWAALETSGTWVQSVEPRAGPDAERHRARVREELRASVTREGEHLISASSDACLSSASSLADLHADAEPFAAGIDLDAIVSRVAPEATELWRHEAPFMSGVPLAPFATDAPGRGWISSAWRRR